MNNLKFKNYYKRNLPHFQSEGGIYAITFRLAFSLPKKYIEKMKHEKKEFDKCVKNLSGEKLESFKIKFGKYCYEEFDDFIGKYQNPKNWLKEKSIALIVWDSIHYWNKKRYRLFCFCIMSNHVHLLIQPNKENRENYYSLAKILYSIKRHTAGKCNRRLNRKGQFWYHESYDHQIRNEEDYFYQLNYIVQNPVKANLVDDWQEWDYTFMEKETFFNL